MRNTLFIFMATVLLLSCSGGKQEEQHVDDFISGVYYEILEEMHRGGDAAKLLERADSCLGVLRSDTSAFFIGLQGVKGHLHQMQKDTVGARADFENALAAIDSRLALVERVSLDDALNRAYMLCMLDRKEEALRYIDSLKFTANELLMLGGQLSPHDVIEMFGAEPAEPDTAQVEL